MTYQGVVTLKKLLKTLFLRLKTNIPTQLVTFCFLNALTAHFKTKIL